MSFACEAGSVWAGYLMQAGCETMGEWNNDLASPAELAWETIRAGLRRDCGARTYDSWLKPIHLEDCDPIGGLVRLSLPSHFLASWVESHFAERLLHAWRAVLPSVKRVKIEVAEKSTQPALYAVETA